MNLILSQESFRIFSQFMVFHVFSLVFEIHIYIMNGIICRYFSAIFLSHESVNNFPL